MKLKQVLTPCKNWHYYHLFLSYSFSYRHYSCCGKSTSAMTCMSAKTTTPTSIIPSTSWVAVAVVFLLAIVSRPATGLARLVYACFIRPQTSNPHLSAVAAAAACITDRRLLFACKCFRFALTSVWCLLAFLHVLFLVFFSPSPEAVQLPISKWVDRPRAFVAGSAGPAWIQSGCCRAQRAARL